MCEIDPHRRDGFRGVPLDTRAQAIKMLAKNALALRRATPVGHRCMSALLSNVDQLTAQAAKMEKVLPEMLKPLAANMVRLSHSLPLQHTQAQSPSVTCSPQMPWHLRTGMGPAVPLAADWFHSVR